MTRYIAKAMLPVQAALAAEVNRRGMLTWTVMNQT